jgi:hypothetical protein
MEIESANMMADFVLSTFVKEFVESFKQSKKISNLSALLKVQDILVQFTSFISRNANRLNVIDLIEAKR